MAEYRILHKKFWSDPKVRDLTDRQRLFFIYAVTGIESCTFTNTGICEIHRSSFQNMLAWELNEIDEIINFFNYSRPDLLEYDHKEHIVYIKSFFKYNGAYKKGISGLIKDFEESGKKVPAFWTDFGQRYRKELNKSFEKLTGDEQVFLVKLFELKDKKPVGDVKNCHIEKMAAQSYSQSY